MEPLSEGEVRVLACLIEKEMSTPEYYPLTLNAVANACNQKSNRHPVMHLSDKDVVRGLDGLRTKGLARVVHLAGSRVPKYEHTFPAIFPVGEAEAALLCELMLRGPQTLGELRTRGSRLHQFGSLEEVEDVLGTLAAGRADMPLVTKLPRLPGRKEGRFAHLLAGPVEAEEDEVALQEPVRQGIHAENERIARLEKTVEELQDEVKELRAALAAFSAQFE